MEESNTLFCSSKFQWARKRISSKFIDNFGVLKTFHSPDLNPPCLQTYGLNFNEDIQCAGLLTVPSLNIREQLSVNHNSTAT